MRIELKETYKLEDQVGYLLRLASQRHTALFQSHMPDGLTATQFAALARLAEQGPCAQNQLGRRTSMDIATIKGVVDRLRQKGLIKTTPSQDDKRLNIVALTKAGALLMATLSDTGHKISADTLAPLTASEKVTFLRLLKKLT